MHKRGGGGGGGFSPGVGEREREDYNLNAFPGRFEGRRGGKGKSGGGWGKRQSTQVGVGYSTKSWNEMYGKFQEFLGQIFSFKPFFQK